MGWPAAGWPSHLKQALMPWRCRAPPPRGRYSLPARSALSPERTKSAVRTLRADGRRPGLVRYRAATVHRPTPSRSPQPSRSGAKGERLPDRCGHDVSSAAFAGLLLGSGPTIAERGSNVPRQKNLKRLVRGRMAKTGESYTAARSMLVDDAPAAAPDAVALARALSATGLALSPELLF